MIQSEEIVKVLRCTAAVPTGDEPCASCPFNLVETMTEEQKAQLHCEEWHSCDVDGAAARVARCTQELVSSIRLEASQDQPRD